MCPPFWLYTQAMRRPWEADPLAVVPGTGLVAEPALLAFLERSTPPRALFGYLGVVPYRFGPHRAKLRETHGMADILVHRGWRGSSGGRGGAGDFSVGRTEMKASST